MATGQSMQLAKQIGEYLAAAELCRSGYVAATFSGNVPYYDILASDAIGNKIAVQVKTIRGGSWQFDARQFVNITLSGNRQTLGKLTDAPYPDLFCVFIVINEYGSDRFFIFTWKDLQGIIAKDYKEWLDKHGGVRPRKADSYHSAVSPDKLGKLGFERHWDVITSGRRSSA